MPLPGSVSFPASVAFPGSGGAAITTDIKLLISRGSPAGTTTLIQGMTQTQKTLDTSSENNPRVGAGNRNGDVLDLITPLTTGSQAPLVYNNHVFGFGTTNPWAHPPKAVEAYQVAAANWTGSFANQENPYFYTSGTTNSASTPINAVDGTVVSNSPGSANPQTSGLDKYQDTTTLLGAVSCITLCSAPTWMTGVFTTAADYSNYNKYPPLSQLATDNTTLVAQGTTGVPAELVTLSATVGAADHANQPDGYRGLYFIDYWRYLVKQVIRRYCLPTSPYVLGTSGTINSGGNAPCTLLQVWNEFGHFDYPTDIVGANDFHDRNHLPEEVTVGLTQKNNNWDWAQYAWFYGHTYQAIEQVMSENSTSRATLGLKIAGPYVPLRWNYYHPTTGTARSTPPVLDTDATYYRLQHADQVIIAQWLMFRTGSGNAYPAHAPGITQRAGTVPQWTPYPSGLDGGVAQNIPAYDMDMLCFDGLQRRSTDPIGAASSATNPATGLAYGTLPDMLEPARPVAQWKAQLLADTPRYEVAYADMAQLCTNCGKPGLPIVQSENYSDVTLNSYAPVAGSESTTGTNHQWYATLDWQCAQTASQWLHMAIGGGGYVLRWQPEGVAILNKNQLPDSVAANTYYPAWTYDGSQQSLWYDGRILSSVRGATPIGTAPGQGAFSSSYTPGQPYPLWYAFKAFHDYFSVTSAGAPKNYYLPTLTNATGGALAFGVEAIDSGGHVLIINKDSVSHSITLVNGSTVTVLSALAAFEVRIIAV